MSTHLIGRRTRDDYAGTSIATLVSDADESLRRASGAHRKGTVVTRDPLTLEDIATAIGGERVGLGGGVMGVSRYYDGKRVEILVTIDEDIAVAGCPAPHLLDDDHDHAAHFVNGGDVVYVIPRDADLDEVRAEVRAALRTLGVK